MTLKQIIDYIKSKHIYPIMHTIAMTAETANCYADFPAKLTEAFREAKRLSVQYMNPREIEGYERKRRPRRGSLCVRSRQNGNRKS
jgi:hypothetical protein